MGNILKGLFGRKDSSAGSRTYARRCIAHGTSRQARGSRRGGRGPSRSHFGGEPRLPTGTDWPEFKSKLSPFLRDSHCRTCMLPTGLTGFPLRVRCYFSTM